MIRSPSINITLSLCVGFCLKISFMRFGMRLGDGGRGVDDKSGISCGFGILLPTNFFLNRDLCALILKEWIMIALFCTCLFHWWIWSSRFFVSDLISFIFIIGWNFLIVHFVLYNFCVLEEGKARWRKEIHLVLSEKNLFLLQPVWFWLC